VKQLALRAMDTAKSKGARYADIRLIESRRETAAVKDGKVESLGDFESLGFGVRVLVGDGWGFASSADITPDEIDRVTARAIEIARASAMVPGKPVDLGPAVKSTGAYSTPIEIDPFSVSIEAKLGVLLDADAIMRRNPGVKVSEGHVISIRHRKTFANTEGALLEQTIYESGGAISATAVNGSEIQVRSYPDAFGCQGTAGCRAHRVGGGCLTQRGRLPERRNCCHSRQLPTRSSDS
jgi:TldD protein